MKKWVASLLLSFFLFGFTPYAGYVDVIKTDKLPREAVHDVSNLKGIEDYADQWQPEWRYPVSKDEVSETIKTTYENNIKLAEKYPDNGELFLLLGLIGYFGHNLDMKSYCDFADKSFAKSCLLLKGDYRPLWLNGMHLTKSTRCIEGMNKMVEAETKSDIKEPLFWNDYAISANLSCMFMHALYALDKFEKITGEKSHLDKPIGDTIKSNMIIPKPGEKIEWAKVWKFKEDKKDIIVFCYPLGYKFKLNALNKESIGCENYNGMFSVIGFNLILGTGNPESLSPQVFIFSYVDNNDGSLVEIKNDSLKRGKNWQKFNAGLGLQEISYVGDYTENSKVTDGGKIVVITFERKDPQYNGFILEEPVDSFSFGKEMTYYRMGPHYVRFKEKIFYQIYLKVPKSDYELALPEFRKFLKTFVVE